jgi:hypothetical protein
MDIDRDVTPDPALVTPAADPTPESDEPSEGEKDLAAFEAFAGEPEPADGSGPLP